MRNSLFFEIKKEYKVYSGRAKSFSLVNQINIRTILFTICITLALYLGLFFFSENCYIHILFIEGNFNNGLILQDLPTNIMNVQIGLFSIFFSLVILITSYIYESKSSDSSFILIKSSLIFPLIIFNLLFLLSFIFNEKFWDSYLQLFPLTLNIIFILFSFYRTLRVLSDYEHLKKTKRSILLNKIKIFNKQLIKERLSKNFDFSKLDGKDYSFSYSFINSKGYDVKSQQQGIITDIKIVDLKKCIKKIESKVPKSVDDASEDIGQTSLGRISIKPIQVNIMCSIGDIVSIDRSLININCSEAVWNSIKIESIETEINNCYKVEDSKHPNQSLKYLFLNIEDKLIGAIQEKKRSLIEDSINEIVEIIHVFETLISFDYDNANKESNNIGGGWSCIEYIVKIIRNSIEESVLLSDIDIINSMTSLSYSVIISAISKKDHYVFNELLFVFPYLYHLAKKHNNKQINDLLISKSISLPVEISNLYISQFIKDASPDEVSTVFNFATKLLKIHQDILKMMIDKSETIEIYLKGVKKFNKMFDSLYYKINEDIEQIFYFMEESKYRDQIYRTDIVGLQYSEVQTKKMAILFVLGNYIFKKGKNEYLDSIMSSLPNEIEYITYIYQISTSFTLENEFGWSWWGIEDYDDLEVHTLDNDASGFFIYYILKNVINFTNTKPEYQFSESLIYEIKNNDSKIIKKLNSINPDDFRDDEYSKIDSLKQYFIQTSASFELYKMNKIASSTIDSQKIDEAKEAIIDGYNTHFGLSDLYKDTHCIEYYEELEGDTINGGYNQLLNKEPYLADGNGIIGIRQYGIGVKDFESQRIFLYWYNNCEKTSISTYKNSTSYNNKNHPIILSTYRNTSKIKEYCGKHYKDSWQIESAFTNTKTIGFYEYNNIDIPIINLGFMKDDEFTEKLFLIDPNIIGKIDFEKVDNSNLKFEFIDLNFDETLRNKILSDNPTYLNDIADKELYLKSKLVFKLITKFKLESDKLRLYEI